MAKFNLIKKRKIEEKIDTLNNDDANTLNALNSFDKEEKNILHPMHFNEFELDLDNNEGLRVELLNDNSEFSARYKERELKHKKDSKLFNNLTAEDYKKHKDSMNKFEIIKETAKDNYTSSINNVYLNQEFIKSYEPDMSDLQKKIVFFAIANLKNEHRDLSYQELFNTKFTLKIDSFIKLMGLDDKSGGYNYKRVADEIKGLIKKPVSYKGEFGKEIIIGWFDSIVYTPRQTMKQILNKMGKMKDHLGNEFDPNAAYISFRFTESMSKILVNLDTYVKYNFLICHSLKNKYAIRIYELLQTRKDTNTVVINIEDFIPALNLPQSYSIKSKMEKNVLQVAEKELNETLSLGFSYSFNGNSIILKAKKNDNDLCKEIFDKEQQKETKRLLIKKENEQKLNQVDHQKKESQSNNFL